MAQTLYEKNMAALEKKYPELAARVRDNQTDLEKFRIVRNKQNEPNILIPTGKDFLLLYDSENPASYCINYISGLKLVNAGIVVFLGFGLGYHLLVFLKLFAARHDTRKIIVFEENLDLFCLALRMVDLQEVIHHDSVHLFIGGTPESALVPIRMDVLNYGESVVFMRGTKIVPVPSCILLNPEYYRKALQVTKRAFRQMAMLVGNDPMDSLLGMDNILGNLKHIVSNPGINLLFDRFRGRPAVTVASGPSLNKNIHLLKEIQDRALIICCDASFLPLMKRGIRPHIVVGFERTDGTEYFYQGISDFEDIFMAICPLVRPKTFDYFGGRKIIVNRTFSHFHWLHQDKGELNIGPSVANMAFKVAEVVGCDPIILIGQDLAFAENGDTHVKDMPFGERDDFYYKNMLEVEGNNGNPVKTSPSWDLFRFSFEEDIHRFHGTCINATEGGAKIRGARVMTFREAIDRHCQSKFDPVSVIKESLSEFGRHLDVRSELHAMLARVRGTHERLNQIILRVKALLERTRSVQKTLIAPFLNGEASIDRKIIEPIINEFLALRNEHVQEEDVYNIMWHTLQPHALWFHNRFNVLPEMYSDEQCLLAAQTLMIKDWLGVTGQLFLSTTDSLKRAEALLIEELERNAA